MKICTVFDDKWANRNFINKLVEYANQAFSTVKVPAAFVTFFYMCSLASR